MPLNIAIAGAGIAGLSAASALLRAGHQVDVFDQSPAPAPVGSGLIMQPVGLAVLNYLGIEDEIQNLGTPIRRLLGRALPSQKAVLNIHYDHKRQDGHGVGVLRSTLYETLLNLLATHGGGVTHNKKVMSLENGQRLVFADGTRSHAYDLVINALGARSPLSPQFGRDLPFGALWANVTAPTGDWYTPDQLEQRYVKASTMVGMLPIGRRPYDSAQYSAFFWSLRQKAYAAWRDAPLEHWKDEVLSVWPSLETTLSQIESNDDLVMARYRHGTLLNPIKDRLIHMGDAYHATSPQLGQGANMALLDAAALALAMEHTSNLEHALHEYARTRRLHIWFYQSLSHVFTPFYQSDNPLYAVGRDQVLARIQTLPVLRWIMSGLISGQLMTPLGAMGLPR